MTTIFAQYDQLAETYSSTWPMVVPGYQSILRTMARITAIIPKPPEDILDLGCGPGSAASAVAPHCSEHARWTLVDGSQSMLQCASQSMNGTWFKAVHGNFLEQATQEQIFKSPAYDLVLLSFALHHWVDVQKRELLEVMATSVRQNGVLLLADEIVVDRPAGWDIVRPLRNHHLQEQIQTEKLNEMFLSVNNYGSNEPIWPFYPARVDDLTSWLARVGFAVSCLVMILGSALLVAIKSK